MAASCPTPSMVARSFGMRTKNRLVYSRLCIVLYHLTTPAGVFIDNAMDLVPIPPWSQEQMSDYFQRTMKDALQHGLTSIHDASTDPTSIKFFMQ
jgi:predicted amidohydrolase YtcJ